MWLMVGLALAGTPRMPKVPFDFEPPELEANDLCFPSGLRLHVVKRPAAGHVSVAMVVQAGEADEPDDLRGAAHVVEHLWFRSHDAGRAPVWDHTLQDHNALTLDDATVYATVGRAEDLDELLAIEAARLQAPLADVTEEILASELAVVQSEHLFRGEHGVRRALSYLDQGIYPPDHRYGRPPASRADIGELPLDRLRAWAAEHYVPAKATLRIEGDVATVDGRTWATRLERAFPEEMLYLGTSTCPAPELSGSPPEPPKPGLLTLEAPVEYPLLLVGWSLPAVRGRDAADLEMAARRLDRRTWGSCWLDEGLQATTLQCLFAFRRARSVASFFQSFGKTVDDLVNPDDAVIQWLGQNDVAALTFVDALGEADDLRPVATARRALRAHVAGGVDALAPTLEALFDQKDADETRAFAMRWLGRARMVGVAIVPGGSASVEGTPATPEVVLTPPSRWTNPGRERLPRATTGTLDNGLSVTVLPVGQSPILHSLTSFRGGPIDAAPPGGYEALAAMRTTMLPSSDALYLRRQVGVTSRALDGAGASLSHVQGPAGVAALVLWMERVRREGLELVSGDRHTWLDDAVQAIPELWPRTPERTSLAIRRERLAPGHAAGMPWWEQVVAGRTVRLGEVVTLSRHVYRPTNGEVVLIGGIPGQVGLGLAGKYLTKWKARDRPSDFAAPPLPPPPARQVLVHETGRVITDVQLTCRLPGRTARSDATQDVLWELLARGAHQSLRTRMGQYDTQVAITPMSAELAYLDVSLGTPHQQAQAAVEVVLGLLERVSSGVSDELLQWAKATARARWGRRWTSAAAATDAVGSDLLAGISAAEQLDWPTRLEAVTAADLTAALADCVGHEVVSVVGPNPGVAGWEAVDWRTYAAEVVESVQ